MIESFAAHQIQAQPRVLFKNCVVRLYVAQNFIRRHGKRREDVLFVLKVRRDLATQLIQDLRKRFRSRMRARTRHERVELRDQITVFLVNRRHANQ